MKAISVKQPWASLIVEGIKPIENRTWPCPEKYNGQRVLIHASGKMDFTNPLSALNDSQRLCFPTPESRHKLLDDSTTMSAIIGSIQIVDCVINHPSIWAEKTQFKISENNRTRCENIENLEVLRDGANLVNPIYNWVLAHPIEFPESIPAKGKLGFWDFPDIIAEPEEKDGELFCHCQLPVKLENQVSVFTGEPRCRYCGGKWYR